MPILSSSTSAYFDFFDLFFLSIPNLQVDFISGTRWNM